MSGPRSNVLSANDISDGLSEEDEMSVTQTRRNLQLLPKRAADFYDRACGRQNGRARYNLGVLIMVGGLGLRGIDYQTGHGVAADPKRAAGDGVRVDPERAAAFKHRACDLGQQSACARTRP